MMKATAPITGGMICPPIDEVASTPPAKAARKPKRFISGMVNWPEATTLATPEPEIVPISAEDSTQTCAGPPRQAADEPERHVVEERDHAGALQERREDHEDEDVGRRDIDRRAVDALGAEAEVLDDLREVVAAVDERRRQVLAEEAVGRGRPRRSPPAAAPSAAAPPRRSARSAPRPTARSAGVRKPARRIRSA